MNTSSLKLPKPGIFWASATIPALIFLAVVYPWLDTNPVLLAIPIIAGTILTVITQVLPVRFKSPKTNYFLVSSCGGEVSPPRPTKTETASPISTSLH
jgi:hypothetical protein